MLELVRRNIFVIIIGVGVIIALLLIFNKEDEPSAALLPITQGELVNDKVTLDDQASQLIVDIKGEVKNPGVYEMRVNARVKDVVKEAGGFTEEADEQMINLAQKVFDEMIIIVPGLSTDEGTVGSTTSSNSKIRINYATLEEIQTLPGIGPSKAKAIFDYREEYGFFQKVEDLLNVSGIGEKTLEAMKEEIQLP